MQRGLIHVHRGRADLFSRADGLSGDVVLSLFEDREGSIWVATTGGIDRFRELPVTTVSARHGLSSDATQSVLAATDGSVWVGAVDGLTRLKDGRATVFRKGRPPLPRDLAIDYTALSLVAPERVLFRYRLEGRDPDWQEAGARRRAFYNDLAPGDYRFRVIACNNSGVWNEAGDTLDFRASPPRTTRRSGSARSRRRRWQRSSSPRFRVRMRIVERHARRDHARSTSG